MPVKLNRREVFGIAGRACADRPAHPFLRLGTVLTAIAVSSFAAAAARAEHNGEQIFKRTCGVCHSIEPGQNRVGPSLAGVVGRKAGSVPGYSYSQANKSSGITWDVNTLDRYIADPKGVVPGTKMTFPGLKDPEDRKAVISYLQSTSR